MFSFRTQKEADIDRERDAEDCEKLLPSVESEPAGKPFPDTHTRTIAWKTTALVVFFTAIISAAFGAWVSRHGRLNSDAFCILHTSQYCKSQITQPAM